MFRIEETILKYIFLIIADFTFTYSYCSYYFGIVLDSQIQFNNFDQYKNRILKYETNQSNKFHVHFLTYILLAVNYGIA